MTDEASVDFPDELLLPLDGVLHHIDVSREADGGTWTITIPLAPFSADDQYATAWRAGTDGPEVVSTSIRLDSIELPGETVADLADRTFQFPVNPTAGYIDGSVYLAAAHNPVDITTIRFGSPDGNRVHTHLVGSINFEFELWGVNNRALELDVDLVFSHWPEAE